MSFPNNEDIAKTPYNMGYVWAIAMVAALGGLMFGYDLYRSVRFHVRPSSGNQRQIVGADREGTCRLGDCLSREGCHDGRPFDGLAP